MQATATIERTTTSDSETLERLLRERRSVRGFKPDPVPADVLFSRKDDSDLVENTKVREGRQLYADRHCASCHALPAKVSLKDCAMPELQSTAPRLDDAGHRLRAVHGIATHDCVLSL